MLSINTVDYPTLSCKSRCAREASPSIIFSTDTVCTRMSLSTLSLSLYNLLSKFANSLDLEDLRRIAKPNQGQTGIPRVDHVSERPTLRPMPRKNIINLSRDMRFPTMWNVGPTKPQISLRIYTQSDQSLC